MIKARLPVVLSVVCLVLIMVAIPFLASCGGPAPAPSPAATPSPKPATSSPAPAATKPAASTQAWTKPISLGSGAIGGVHYVIQTGAAAIISKYTGVSATCEATKWSGENVDLLRDKQIEFTTCTSDTVYDAWTGTGFFPGKPQKFIRFYHSGWMGCTTFVTRANSGIKTFADLKGKKFYSWMQSSPVIMRTVESVLKAHNFTKTDVTLQDLVSTAEAITALKENRTDIIAIPGGVPAPAIIELAQTTDVRIVGMDDADRKTIQTDYPYFGPVLIPAKTYKGQDADVYTYGSLTNLVTHADLPDELVYRVVKALMDHPAEVKAIHPNASYLVLEKFWDAPGAPFHPGAIQYYKEKGVWTAEKQAFQDKMLK